MSKTPPAAAKWRALAAAAAEIEALNRARPNTRRVLDDAILRVDRAAGQLDTTISLGAELDYNEEKVSELRAAHDDIKRLDRTASGARLRADINSLIAALEAGNEGAIWRAVKVVRERMRLAPYHEAYRRAAKHRNAAYWRHLQRETRGGHVGDTSKTLVS